MQPPPCPHYPDSHLILCVIYILYSPFNSSYSVECSPHADFLVAVPSALYCIPLPCSGPEAFTPLPPYLNPLFCVWMTLYCGTCMPTWYLSLPQWTSPPSPVWAFMVEHTFPSSFAVEQPSTAMCARLDIPSLIAQQFPYTPLWFPLPFPLPALPFMPHPHSACLLCLVPLVLLVGPHPPPAFPNCCVCLFPGLCYCGLLLLLSLYTCGLFHTCVGDR